MSGRGEQPASTPLPGAAAAPWVHPVPGGWLMPSPSLPSSAEQHSAAQHSALDHAHALVPHRLCALRVARPQRLLERHLCT